jgi:hypothetical protein
MYWQYTTAPAGSLLNVTQANPNSALTARPRDGHWLREVMNLTHGDSSRFSLLLGRRPQPTPDPAFDACRFQRVETIAAHALQDRGPAARLRDSNHFLSASRTV